MKRGIILLLVSFIVAQTRAGAPEIVRLFVPQDSIVFKENSCEGVIELELAAQSDSLLVGLQLSSDGGLRWETPLLTDYFFFCKPGFSRLKFKVAGRHGPDCMFRATAYDTLPVVDGMRFVPSRERCFYMGSQTESAAARPKHPVVLSYDFLMDTTEMTSSAFQLFKPAFVPALMGVYHYEEGASADNVFWHEAVRYCNRKSVEGHLDTCYSGFDSVGSFRNFFKVVCDYTKNGYRLPSEAEWEFACRAGSAGKYYWGEDSSSIRSYVWFSGNFDDTIHAVAKKPPNRFGLYDMNGNALEMTNDWYDSLYYASSPKLNPTGPAAPPEGDPDPVRVVRGGHALSAAKYISSSGRLYNFSSASHMNSFRCVRTYVPGAAINKKAHVRPDEQSGSAAGGGGF